MSPPSRCLFCCCSTLIAVYELLSMSAAMGDANSSAISFCSPFNSISFAGCANLGANPFPFSASATCAASPSYVLSNCTPSSAHAYWDSFSDAALGVVGSPAVTAFTQYVLDSDFEIIESSQEITSPVSHLLSATIQISWNLSLVVDLSDPCLPDLYFSATNLSLYNIPSSINLARFPDSAAISFASSNTILLFNCARNISDVGAQLGSTYFNNELIDDDYGCLNYKALCKRHAETPCIQWSVGSLSQELMLQQVLDSLACSHFMLGMPFLNDQHTVFNFSMFELLWEDTECRKCQVAGGQCTYDAISIGKFRHCKCWNYISRNSSTFDFNTQICSSPWNGPCYIRGPWYCLSIGAKIGVVVGAILAALGLCVLIRAGFPRFSKFSVPILLSIMKKIVRKLQAVSYQHRRSLELLDLDGLTERATEYCYSSIESATNSFSSFVGEGGFGRVYKGTLMQARSSHGGLVEQQIAVKVLDAKSKHSKKQFLNEVVTIGKIHHVNVVRLLGFCMEEDQVMLVYEYVVNGSLDRWLFEKEGKAQESHVLNWGQRYAIALGVARGLSYLHEECRHRTVHRDIKPQNILLDEDMHPKIADFGLARLMNREESKVVTLAKGTPGYMAPEFWMGGESQLSTKFDVYSYGMVLLELISGQRNFGGGAGKSESYGGSFPAMAFKAAMEGHLESIMDARMEIRSDAAYDAQQQVQWQQIRTAAFVALWCIQDHPARRPHMSEVVKYLEGGAIISEYPPQPTIPFSCASTCPQQEFLLASSHVSYINECTPLSGGR